MLPLSSMPVNMPIMVNRIMITEIRMPIMEQIRPPVDKPELPVVPLGLFLASLRDMQEKTMPRMPNRTPEPEQEDKMETMPRISPATALPSFFLGGLYWGG